MNKNDFTEDIFDHIKERLEDYEGQTFYTCDLVSELTMYENMNGAWVIGTYRASEYIKNHWDEASDTFEHYKDEMDLVLNPFDNPEAFTFYMLDYGVSRMMWSLEAMNQYDTDQIELTPETITEIISQADEITDVNPF